MATHDLAIYMPLAGPLYAEGGALPSGGAELQMVLLARGLAARGLRVCHIVSYPRPLPASVTGVDLIVEPPRAKGDPRIGPVARAVRSLDRADAHVYLQRTVSHETGLVGGYARLRRRPFVHSVASRFQLPPAVECSALTKLAYRFGLACATAIVTQTEEQRRSVERLLGRAATTIPSISETSRVSSSPRDMFLWVGGLIDFKDPLAFLALAERVPEASFVMVAGERGPAWQALAEEVATRAAALDNVTLLGPRPRAELGPLYDRAVAVVSTSTFEGFPNVFLEGWSHGALSLSLRIDPDGVIARHGLGDNAGGSLEALAGAARAMWSQRSTDGPRRDAVRRYIAEHHDLEAVASQWAAVLRGLLPARRAASLDRDGRPSAAG